MRICFISDTHTWHGNIVIPQADILVHCGDNTIYGEIWEMKNFIEWFGNQKPKHKIFINGNHEVMVAKLGNYTKQMVNDFNKYNFTNVCYLEDEAIEIEGVKFYGSPWTPEFFPENWAYQLYPDKAELLWGAIPEETDVLITHGPPCGVLDAVRPFGRYDRTNAGCPELMKRVKELKPKVHAFGHIHHEYGYRKLANPAVPTLFVNAAICNANYNPVNKPIVVDTDTWEIVDA